MVRMNLKKPNSHIYVVYMKPTPSVKTKVESKKIKICHTSTNQKKAGVAI